MHKSLIHSIFQVFICSDLQFLYIVYIKNTASKAECKKYQNVYGSIDIINMWNVFKNIFLNYNLNLIFFLLSCIYWFIVKNYWNNIFVNNNFSISEGNNVFIFIALLIIILAGQGFCFIFKKWKNNDSLFKIQRNSFIILLVLNLILYFLTEHGLFNGDELSTYNEAAQIRILPYYLHTFSIIYFIIAYIILPFKSGVVLFQILIYSLITSYIFSKLYITVNYKFKWILFIPFILPSILRFNIQPLRNNIYYVFFILLFALIYFKYKEQKEVSYKDIFIYSVLSVMITLWRGENIILLFLLPIAIKFIFNKNISLKKLLLYCFIFLSASCYLNYKFDLPDYKILAIIRPLTAILKTDFKTNNKDSDLKIISNVINIKDYINENIARAIYINSYSENYSIKNLNKLYPIYIKLVMYNPKTFLKDRLTIYNGSLNCAFLRDYIQTQSNISTIKGKTLNILEGRDSNYNLTIFTKIMYNLSFILIVLITSLIISIKKKDKALFIMVFISLLLGFLIYITSAEAFFHYYLQMYLLGCILFTYFVMYLINQFLVKQVK